MWLVRVFESAFVRKLAYIAAVALAGLVIGHRSHAATVQIYTAMRTNTCDGTDAATVASCTMAFKFGSFPYGGCTPPLSAFAGSPPDQYWDNSAHGCGAEEIIGPSTVTCPYHTAGGSTIPCPTDCTGLANMDIVAAIKGNTGTVAGGLCVNGCGYTNSAAALAIGGPRATVYGQAVPTGSACGTSDTPGTQGNCASGGGATTCYDAVTGKAIVNGDVIQKTDIPPKVDTCTQYASGGTLCTYAAGAPSTATPASGLTTPPAPSTDASTVVDPVATVTAGDGAGGTLKAGYFSAAQNQASVNPTSGTAKPGSGGIGGGTGTGGPSAPNGDCGATGVDCAGDSALPSLDRTDSVQSQVQGYIDSIKASPIMTFVQSVENGWPDGTASAPTVPFTIYGHSFDMMAPVAQLWSGTVAPGLSYVFLVLYLIMAAKIVLSA